MSEEVPKKMTDEERMQLAAKLDKDLDDFIDGLEKRRYTEGWPEDRWEEEMSKHPFFMKKAPEPGDELSPLMQGMQMLKYDPNENTAEELALNYKEDGNYNMKFKNYRIAIIAYTEALNQKCGNDEIQATLYNNRSTANFFLKNYRSSLIDCQKALKLQPDYAKAKWRAAQCANHLDKFDLCLELSNEILLKEPDNQKVIDLMKECTDRRTTAERDLRKRKAAERRKIENFSRLTKAFHERGLKFEGGKIDNEESLRPNIAPLMDFPVSFHQDEKALYWPITLCYPEFLTSDFYQQLNENVKIFDFLNEILDNFTYDADNYTRDKVNIYYESRLAMQSVKIDVNKSLAEVMQEKGFFVTDGYLLFFIVPKNSKVEETYLNEAKQRLLLKSKEQGF